MKAKLERDRKRKKSSKKGLTRKSSVVQLHREARKQAKRAWELTLAAADDGELTWAVGSLLQASGSKRMKKAHSSATVEEFYAAEIIREAFNAFRFRRNMEKRIQKRKEADAATDADPPAIDNADVS